MTNLHLRFLIWGIVITMFLGFFQVSSLWGQDRVPFDAYFHNESQKIKKNHLDNFVRELRERAADTAYIIFYSGQKEKASTTARELAMVRRYLGITKNVNRSRFFIIQGGTLPKGVTYIYFVSKGADPPKPSPPE